MVPVLVLSHPFPPAVCAELLVQPVSKRKHNQDYVHAVENLIENLLQ